MLFPFRFWNTDSWKYQHCTLPQSGNLIGSVCLVLHDTLFCLCMRDSGKNNFQLRKKKDINTTVSVMESQNKSISTRHLNSIFINTSTTFFFYRTLLLCNMSRSCQALSSFNSTNHKRNWTRGSTVTTPLNTGTHIDRVHVAAPQLHHNKTS